MSGTGGGGGVPAEEEEDEDPEEDSSLAGTGHRFFFLAKSRGVFQLSTKQVEGRVAVRLGGGQVAGTRPLPGSRRG